MKEQIKYWWENCRQRERQLLVVTGVLVILLFIWIAIYQPIQQHIKHAQQQRNYQQQNLVWMQQHSEELITLRKERKSTQRQTDSIESLIYKSAKQHQIKIQRLQLQGKQVLVEIELIIFSQLLDWFVELEQQLSIDIATVEISSNDKLPGMINVNRLLLQGYING